MNEGALYLTHEPIIAYAARAFCEKFPHLDYEEVRGEANIHAVHAIRSYRPEQGTKIETWIVFVIHRGLIDKTKRGFHSNLAKAAFPPYTGADPQARSRFNLRMLMNEVSEDARKTINLVIREELGKGLLKQVLSDLGWTKKRIEETFNEIREAL